MKRGGGLRLDTVAVDDSAQEAQSYQIQHHKGLQLRAFLFTNGSIYSTAGEHLRELGSIKEDDIDMTSKKNVGKGASGTVYYAQLKSTGEPLALKYIPITSKPHRDEVDRELSFFSSRGDNAFVMHNLGAYWDSEENAVVLPMQWMPYTVKDLCLFWGELDEQILADVFYQIIRGLQYLHDVKRLIHRDLKPSNILIGSDGYVKIADFGVSKLVQTLDVSSTYVGTMYYMAPERLEQSTYSFSSDVWSLGLTVIGTITGKNPWGDVNLFQLMQKISGNAIPELPASYSPVVRDFIAQCLHRDPDQRPTCKQLLEHPFLTGRTEASATANVKLVIEQMTRLIRNQSAKQESVMKSEEELAAIRNARIDQLEGFSAS